MCQCARRKGGGAEPAPFAGLSRPVRSRWSDRPGAGRHRCARRTVLGCPGNVLLPAVWTARWRPGKPISVVVARSRGVRDWDCARQKLARILERHPGRSLSAVARVVRIFAVTTERPLRRFPAEWTRYGRFREGAIRNAQMARHATHLIVLWDGQSRGTRDMICQARAGDLQVRVLSPDQGQNARGAKAKMFG